MPLRCKSGYCVGPDAKKIAYHCLPSDAVRLKVLLSKLSFIKPIISGSDISRYNLYFKSGLCKICLDEGMLNGFTGVSNIFHTGIIS